jgi:hypothetical protein
MALFHIYICLCKVERVVSPNPAVDTVKSNDSDKTLSGSSDSIGTAYRLDSQDSTTSVEGREGVRIHCEKKGHARTLFIYYRYY